MPAQLITETEPITVSSLAMLIYGPPGAWKTSVAQTAVNPVTLDFDKGIHRAFNRRAAFRFDCWNDVNDPAIAKQIAQSQTVVVDTIGRLLDLMSLGIIEENAKWGTRAGGLSLQGFGVLKARFGQWASALRLAGKDIVFICHEKEEKDGDDRIMRPDIQGGSYTEVMKFTDLVGYLGVDRQGKRVLDFNPSDKHLGKNAAGWSALPVPDLKSVPSFLADLLYDAKKRIGQTSEAAAKIAATVAEYSAWLDGDSPSLDGLNERLPELATLEQAAKVQVWSLMMAYGHKCDWSFDRTSKKFVAAKAGAA